MNAIVGVMIAAVCSGIIMVPMLRLTVTQAQSRASLEATLLYASEVDRAKRIWSVDNVDFDARDLYSSYCKKGPDYGYNDEGFNFQVTCETGKQKVGGKDLLLSFPALSRNPGQFTDQDQDGFEDVSGLPTHYDQCYSGWKGDGFKTTACAMGGQYVIPMYASLYN